MNELLIQMQSFDQPPWPSGCGSGWSQWMNGYLPEGKSIKTGKPTYNNILLIAATNRADDWTRRCSVPGGSTGGCTSTCPTKQGRRDLIDFFLARKSHEQLDVESERERLAHDTFGYTPVLIEHLFDEALLVALRDGRRR